MITHRVSLLVDPDRVDEAAAFGYAFDMLGCQEEPCDAVVRIALYFRNKISATALCASLAGHAWARDLRCDAAPDQDWNAAWRAAMQPALLAPGIWVSPSWLPPETAPGDLWIRIEPKMAFGAGHHESTRLAARALLDLRDAVSGGTVLDIGTGSGVLCFAADHAGTAFALGLEIDPACRANLAENRAANPPNGTVSFLIGGIDALQNRPCFDAAVMNMIYSKAAPLLPSIAGLLIARGRLIWSGILADGWREAIDAAARCGFLQSSERTDNEWWCGTFVLDR
jgi:ribosomal protein L11 methyltransferase